MADYEQKQFFGTPQTCINTATDVASGNFSGAPSATYDNTTDAAIPYAPYAVAMIELPDWGGVPTAGGSIGLWGVLKNTDGTDDDTDAPASTSAGGAWFFGAFPVHASDSLQRRTITIDVLGMKEIDFYIQNNTDQNLNNDGGTSCVLKVTPLALGVVA